MTDYSQTIFVSARRGGKTSVPLDEDAPDAWVRRLEGAARKARSSRVRVSRAKLVKLCLLVRLATRMLERIDAKDVGLAKTLLREYVDSLGAESVEVDGRKLPLEASSGVEEVGGRRT